MIIKTPPLIKYTYHHCREGHQTLIDCRLVGDEPCCSRGLWVNSDHLQRVRNLVHTGVLKGAVKDTMLSFRIFCPAHTWCTRPRMVGFYVLGVCNDATNFSRTAMPDANFDTMFKLPLQSCFRAWRTRLFKVVHIYSATCCLRKAAAPNRTEKFLFSTVN